MKLLAKKTERNRIKRLVNIDILIIINHVWFSAENIGGAGEE